MHVLIRPAMYGAHHPVLPVREPGPDEPLMAMDVVGPICESSDVLGRDRMLPDARRPAIWSRSRVPAPTAR